jgi:hypothetical protein
MVPLAAAGAAVGLIGGIGSIIGNAKSNRQLERLIKQNPTYKSSPYAGQRMALAQQLLNARQPGAAAAERNIYGSQASTLANVQRNATDSSQALALAAGAQGQTNQAFGDLAQQEAQGYQQRYQNLAGAQEGMIQEGDKVYQDQVRRFQDLAAIRGAQSQNRQSMWQGISNMGFGAMNFGLASGGGAGAGAGASGGMGAYMGYAPASTYRVPMAGYGSPNTGNIPLPR